MNPFGVRAEAGETEGNVIQNNQFTTFVYLKRYALGFIVVLILLNMG